MSFLCTYTAYLFRTTREQLLRCIYSNVILVLQLCASPDGFRFGNRFIHAEHVLKSRCVDYQLRYTLQVYDVKCMF